MSNKVGNTIEIKDYVPPPGTRLVKEHIDLTGGSVVRTVEIEKIQPAQEIIGGCPNCRVGFLEDEFTCCGVCCAICFFPLGLVCCYLMRERRCVNCKASF